MNVFWPSLVDVHCAGANIKMIQAESNAKVDVSRETNEVTISGEPSQVAKAKELITAILEGGPVGPPPEAEKTIEAKSAGAVIGRGGATIRKIQEDTGARVDISKDSSGPDVITISGKNAVLPTILPGGQQLSSENALSLLNRVSRCSGESRSNG